MGNPPPRDNSPTAFFALTLLLSAPLYLLNALAFQNLLGSPETGPLYITLLTFTPAVAASLLTWRRRRSGAVKGLLSRALDVKRVTQTRWVLTALLLGPLIFVLSVGWMALLNAPMPSAMVPILALPAVIAFVLLLAAGEEVGWMGYAAEPLQARHGALRAALILGVIWAMWHLPFFVFLFPDPISVGAQLLTLIGARILLFWIFNNAGKSVFAAILYHAADNTAFMVLPDIKSVVPLGSVVQCGVTLAVALAVVLLWNSSTLTRFRFGARSTPNVE